MINTPAEITTIVSDIGVYKSQMKRQQIILNGVMGGAFVALGGMFAINTTTGLSGVVPFGLIRLIAGLVFCVGLILCMVAGGELYTGNALLIIAKADGRITWSQWMKNLGIVWIGNLIGSLAIVGLLFFAAWHLGSDAAIANNIIKTGIHKVELNRVQALSAGILCNILVCLGVWMAYVGKTVSDKVLGIIFPITAFVAGGFEHVVANMFYLPYAYLLQHLNHLAVPEHIITMSDIIIHNFIPVSIGNFIGGSCFVGLLYWMMYGNKDHLAKKH